MNLDDNMQLNETRSTPDKWNQEDKCQRSHNIKSIIHLLKRKFKQ